MRPIEIRVTPSLLSHIKRVGYDALLCKNCSKRIKLGEIAFRLDNGLPEYYCSRSCIV